MPKPNHPTDNPGPKPRAEFTIQDRFFNKRQDPEVQRDWLNKIQKSGRNLTQWEMKFIEDMNYKLKMRWRLTEVQAQALENIYADRTPT